MNIKKSLIGCYVYENDKNEYFNYEIIGNEVRVYAWIKNFRMSHYNIEDVTNDEKIEKYNQALQALCDEQQIGFIDNTVIVENSDYEEDGIHLKSPFYPRWAVHMAEVTSL